MKSRHDRVRASVLAVAVVISAAGWATAQQVGSSSDPKVVRGSGTAGTIPLWTGKDTIGNSSITQSSNGDQTINGSLSVNGSLFLPATTDPNTGVISIGGVPVLYTLSSPSCPLVCGRNTFVGPSAGNFTTTGFANTATGDEALDSITTGDGNTATGFAALVSNTTGGSNTATGWRALRTNTTGAGDTATGAAALENNTTGYSNTATGIAALEGNATGSMNTAIGWGALLQNRSGFYNTAIGFLAGLHITGSNNIDIGANVMGVGGEFNTLRIGNTAPLDGSVITRAFIGGIYGVPTGLPGAAVFVDANGQLGTISSSARFKDDIQDMGDASSDLMKLRPVTFRYKQAQEDGSHPLQYGLVAEEVAEVNPGLVQFDKDGQPQTVLYHVLPAMLLNELQKEHQKIEDQEKLIQSQQEQLKAQEERLRKLEAILSGKTK